MHEDFDGYLYHAAPASKLASILTEGLRPGSYLGTDAIAAYYIEDISDTEAAVLLKVPIEAISGLDLAPDMAGLEEPITTVVGCREEEVWEHWQASDGGWRDCFEIIGSLRCMDLIPASCLVLEEDAPEP